MKLCPKPNKPQNSLLLDGHSIVCRSIDSAESFFAAFNQVRKGRGAKGTPTDHEQDLLRAALLFAAAGLDAMVKQLVRDTLPSIIEKHEGAEIQFLDYVQGRITKNNSVDVKLIAKSLLAPNSREHLCGELVRELTGSSLQSKDQLLRVAAYFAIPPSELTTKLEKLKEVFDVRNQIAHEMDVLLGQPNRSRRSRMLSVMKEYTAFVLQVSVAYFKAVEIRL